jgi:hypothetical protein
MLFGSLFAGIVLAVLLITRPVLEKKEELANAT